MKADHSLGLRNIDADMEQWLERVGVTNRAQFEKLGAHKTYKLLLEAGYEPDPATLAMLVGAEEDLDWHIVAQREHKFENLRTADIDEP